MKREEEVKNQKFEGTKEFHPFFLMSSISVPVIPESLNLHLKLSTLFNSSLEKYLGR